MITRTQTPRRVICHGGTWWLAGLQMRSFMITVGRSFVLNRIGIEVCIGESLRPEPYIDCYRHRWFLPLWPK
jgi:hypothetical protein